MKVKFTLALLICSFFTSYSFGQETIKDRRTNPDIFFLEMSDVANSLDLLPAPPEINSLRFLNDRAQYEWGKLQRNTPRGILAKQDAMLENGGLQKSFSDAFGIEITKANTPEIFKLIENMREDAGDLATRDAKQYYMRVRPFMFFSETSLTPEKEEELIKNGSFPSGHSAIGWATSLVLTEINIDRQNELLKKGYEFGQSRVICGVHWQSDVDAGRIVGSEIVARLHADDKFNTQLKKAKDEFKSLEKNGKITPSTRDKKH